MFKLLIPVIVLATLVGAVVLTDRAGPRADFEFINRGDVNILDPQRMSWMQDLRVARLLFEGLAQNDVFDPNFTVRPTVAERWDIDRLPLLDQRGEPVQNEKGFDIVRERYTFHLRQDPPARWTNGEPVTAQDFVYSWRRALMPDTAADYFKLFTLILGAEEFYEIRTELLAQYGERPQGERTMENARALLDQTMDIFANGISKADASALVQSVERREKLGLDDPERAWPLDNGVGLRALDDFTLEVTIVRPTPYFIDIVAFAVFYPVYPPLVDLYTELNASSGGLTQKPGWTKPGVIVTNGPFELVGWRFKRDMRLEQNPYYWDRESLHLQSIGIPSMDDRNAMILAFETGVVDWVSDVQVDYRGGLWAKKKQFYEENREEYERLKAMGLDQIEIDRRLPDDPRKNIHVIRAFGTYFYNFNCSPTLPDGRDNPFADARVRRAFAMAIDKEAVARDIRRIDEPVARTLTPPNSIAGYDVPEGLICISDGETPEERQAIADRARALLIEAMQDLGMGDDPSEFITVELLFNKDGAHELIAQSVAKNWQKYLGVPTRLSQKEIKVFRNDLKKHNFITARAGWYGDYGDPTTFMSINKTGDGNNDRNYSNPEFDALLERANYEPDPAERMTLLRRAEEILVEEDLPLVPIFHYSNVYMFDANRVSGINPHPRTKQNLFLVDILGDGQGAETPLTMPVQPATTRN